MVLSQSDGQEGRKAPSEAKVTHSEASISALKFMIKEEKRTGDLYADFYDLYGVAIFTNIAATEDKPFDALIGQAERIGVEDDAFEAWLA